MTCLKQVIAFNRYLGLAGCCTVHTQSNWVGHAGVLVLSEFAGAAQSLGAGAILVNPWNITDMAAAIEDALTMSDQASTCRVQPILLGL